MHHKRMARRTGLLGLGTVLILAGFATAVARGADDDAKGKREPVGLVGVVQKIADDSKSLTFKAKKGPYTVTWDKNTRWVAHEQITLGDVKSGSTIHVLAAKQAAQPATKGGNFPPQMIKIQAIVVGGAFEPPIVPARLSTQGIVWTSGELKVDGKELRLGEHVVGVGLDRKVLRVKNYSGAVPARKTQLFIAGFRDLSDRKNKTLLAREVIRIDPRYKDYDRTHDLKKRLPKLTDEEKKKGGGFGL